MGRKAKAVKALGRGLFDESEAQDMFDTEEGESAEEKRAAAGPVECLGQTFPNEEERRKYFLAKLAEKLKDPEFRKIEGFPIGKDEDILALSNPPFYTACPNPFLEELIQLYGKPYDPKSNQYRREPFAADVSEGKNDPIYNAHSYHTKVPYKAIMQYILHYTDPGDIVLDGFSGTGMTGVAAQLCGDRKTVESLGIRVKQNGILNNENGVPFSSLGKRNVILADLSPLATFISYNHNYPCPPILFSKGYSKLVSKIVGIENDLYPNLDENGKQKGLLNYVIWSDVYVCRGCNQEYAYWDAAVDLSKGEAKSVFNCPHCNSEQSTRNLERAYSTEIDLLLKKPIRLFKQIPVRASFIPTGKTKMQRPITTQDKMHLKKIEGQSNFREYFPLIQFPKGDRWKRDAFESKGVTHVHHFFTPRTIEALGSIWNGINENSFSYQIRMSLWFLFTSFSDRNATKRNRFIINKHNPRGRINGPMANTLYLPNLFCEMNIFRLMTEKYKDILSAFKAYPPTFGNAFITTGSSSTLTGVPSDSVDYIFTDPPFGHNIQYSELNLSLESFLKVRSYGGCDTVVNEAVGKPMAVYTEMMLRIFREYYRILKPGKWMTVEFHNSQSAVWVAIQEALGGAGFVIAHVATLDKKQKTVHQDTNTRGTVNQDLVISAYKPNGGLEQRFKISAGSEEGVWDFVRTHLKQLPVFVAKNGQAELITERQSYLLFDRMVAFHVQRGVTFPLSAAEFYLGLTQRFVERDGMFFLPEHAAEYDNKRQKVKEITQLEIAPCDEATSIEWIRQQLIRKPQTFQELHPLFTKDSTGWQKHEVLMDLSLLLEQNFIRYDGQGEVSTQIHKYLSSNYKEMRNLSKDDAALRMKAKDRWYVPDPNKAGDLEKLRERALLREFEDYRESGQKRLKVFRLEAVRAGFKKAWQEREYDTIIAVAEMIPEDVLQEDPKLLMWFDQAMTRKGDNK